MKLTNIEIYQLASELMSNFKDLDIYIPAKANFFIQKNINTLVAAAQEIEKTRQEIIEHYGILDEKTQNYNFTEQDAAAANQELEELFSIEQEVDIKQFSIEALGNVECTPTQMQNLMIMIED